LPVIASVITEQIGLLGWLVAALGLRWWMSGLLALGGALLVSAAPFPGPWDPQVDTLLPLAIAWALIGFGVGRVSSWGPKATPVACTLAVSLPLLQVGRSIAADKIMVDRSAGNMLAAFSSQQAGPGGIVLEDATSGRLLLWANHRRDPDARWQLVPQDRSLLAERAARDTPLFAFEGGAARVALLGLTGPPVEVKGRTLASLFESVDPAAVVGLVVSPGAMPVAPDDRRALGALVSERAVPAEGGAVALFARRSIGLTHIVHGDSAIELAAGPSIRSDVDSALVPPTDTRLKADAAGARVELGSREIAKVDRGALVAWWSPPDQQFDWLPFHAGSTFTAPWRHQRWSVSRIRSAAACVPVEDSWSDATESARAGRLGVALGTGVQLRIYLAHERPLFIRGAGFPGRSSPDLTVVSWDRADADQSQAAANAMAADGVPENAPGQAGRRYAWQVTLDAGSPEPGVLAIGLGGAPAWALVRRSAGRPDALASVCGGVAGERLFMSGEVRDESLSLAGADSFAAGWLPLERTATGRSRTLGESGGEMLVRLDVPQDVEVVVTARADRSIGAGGALALHVNDIAEGERAVETQTTSYSWRVPAQHWLPGTNRLLLRSDGAGGASLPLVVTDVRFRR
jgi:hypothetical protein